MTDIVMDKVKNSREFDEFMKTLTKRFTVLVNNIKLQTAGYKCTTKVLCSICR